LKVQAPMITDGMASAMSGQYIDGISLSGGPP
jgi:hypothetical protein